jgi:hypothetical protein
MMLTYFFRNFMQVLLFSVLHGIGRLAMGMESRILQFDSD